MKYKFGFTVMEMLVVIGILLILIAVVLSSLSISQKRTRDDRRVSTLQEIMLALEQYRDVCREYPNRLVSEADNGCPTGGGTDTKFGYFLSDDAMSALQSNTFGIRYGAFMSNAGGRCTGYHIGIPLETSHPSLDTADDQNTTSLQIPCYGTITNISSGFNGVSEDCAGAGLENRCLDFKKGNP